MSKLTPIVREDNSEIWVTWNPETKGSRTDLRFRQNPPKNSAIVENSEKQVLHSKYIVKAFDDDLYKKSTDCYLALILVLLMTLIN